MISQVTLCRWKARQKIHSILSTYKNLLKEQIHLLSSWLKLLLLPYMEVRLTQNVLRACTHSNPRSIWHCKLFMVKSLKSWYKRNQTTSATWSFMLAMLLHPEVHSFSSDPCHTNQKLGSSQSSGGNWLCYTQITGPLHDWPQWDALPHVNSLGDIQVVPSYPDL